MLTEDTIADGRREDVIIHHPHILRLRSRDEAIEGMFLALAFVVDSPPRNNDCYLWLLE
jgi:hypothetical protein